MNDKLPIMTNETALQRKMPGWFAQARAASGDGPLPEVPAPETGFGKPRRIGMTIAFLVFGVFGLWSVLAPIDGAVHGPGIITVKSYKKVVQHLEGGIIREIRVQNGDLVQAGEVLLVIDPTQSEARLEMSTIQMLALQAQEARLLAERDGLGTVVFPSGLAAGPDNSARAEVQAQIQIFNARKAAREGAKAVMEQRIGQLQSRVVGLQALQESKNMLAASFADELNDVRSLLAEGFADKLRLRELERNHASLLGEAAELAANIASTEIQIGETRLQILQQEHEFQQEVASELAETQNRLGDFREQVSALTDIVARTEVRAPVTGLVTGLQFHTEGGVVPPGTPIAEIVPQSEELIVEARIAPTDIDRLETGLQATVRLPNFNAKTIPTLYGNVLTVSADTVTDQNTGGSYYVARVELDEESLAALEGLILMQGMPAEVLISTGSRTFLQYLMQPLSNALVRSFIEE